MRGVPGKQGKAADRRHIAHTTREANAALRRPPPSPGGLAPIRAPRGVKALVRIHDTTCGPFLAVHRGWGPTNGNIIPFQALKGVDPSFKRV